MRLKTEVTALMRLSNVQTWNALNRFKLLAR